ncbi:ribonuclease HII [Candidatus Microgenomates bacterium]|nr:ribonuclease HII [Candidatus Microgenomates bacterium]
MIYPDIKLEEELWKEGYKYVVGLDEAGRGPLAGPVVAGAVVILGEDQIVSDVRDSKKMSEKKRELAFVEIQKISSACGVGVVSASEIDTLGIQKAVQKAMMIAMEIVESKLGSKIDFVIADGENILSIPRYKMKKMNKGDLLHYSISAGSVLAKVTRDHIMYDYAKRFPEYGFDSHVGYGTKKHIEALEKFGACDIHRRSFNPVSKFLKV